VGKESVFKKKGRVRPPRVHIEYEVELGGAQVMKELPFVMGVMSDLSGQPKQTSGSSSRSTATTSTMCSRA
jgi:type VI secretion system protein ImpB